jgi:tetratricopeptide (TPR) repeat protein
MTSRTVLAAALAAGISSFALSSVSFAEAISANALHPWEQARAIVAATEADLARRGFLAINDHLSELEQTLAEARRAYEVAQTGADTVYVLANGQAEVLAGLFAASASGRYAVAIENPYPIIGMLLGSYYNEIGQPSDAVRVLEMVLALPRPDDMLRDMLPHIMSERGAALNALKRWDDALANYDGGLEIVSLPPEMKARLLRGRGFALTELGRLNEAEGAYRESLVSEPNNLRALHELNYIARLRDGAPPVPGGLVSGLGPIP